MNLPCPLTNLIGREGELATVHELLARARLVTITGAGGVGKTRLALAAATSADFPSVQFVDLAPVAEPEHVPGVIAQALGVHDGPDIPVLDRIAAMVGVRRLLLVLDNCEQVAVAAPAFAHLLGAAPNLVILATSRIPLNLSGEQEFALAPLRLPQPTQGERHISDELHPLAPVPPANLMAIGAAPAVQLFVQRAAAVRAGFALSEANAKTVAQICARLDGLPLALELAAAQLRALTPEALLARLERRLPLLTGGPRDAPARHRTLRDTIRVSIDLLTPDERRGFWRLAALVGGCTLEAVAAICTEPEGAADAGFTLVRTLVAHSLLQQCGPVAEPRYVMLEAVREYAGELLAASGEEHAIRRRHADYFVALAERAEEGLLWQAQQHWFDRLSGERENIRAAVEWAAEQGDRIAGSRVGAALWRFWWVCGGLRQGLSWLQAGLADLELRDGQEGDRAHVELRARALAACGNLALAVAEYQLAERSHQEALALYRVLNHHLGTGRSLYNLGLVGELQGDTDLAEQYYRAALAHDRAAPFPYGIGLFLRGLSATALARGDLEQAYALARQAVDVSHARRQPLPLVQAVLQLGLAALACGKPAEAEECAREAIATLQANRGQVWLAEALMVLSAAVAAAEPVRAAKAFAVAEQLLAYHHAPLAPKVYALIVPYVRSVHDRLGSATFAAAWREGRGLSFEGAIALAEPTNGRAAEELVRSLPAPAATTGTACLDALSRRELEILGQLATGRTNKEIAEALLMSANTVHSHVKSIFSKLDVTSRAAATREALVRGLITP